MPTPFVEAALVAFREGLEAALMLATLTAYLLRSNGRHKLRALASGAAAGAVAALAFGILFDAGSIGADPLLQGLLTLGSALLMTYVSGGMWIQRAGFGLQKFIKEQASQAVESKTGLAILMVALLAVFREGAEVALFLRMIAASSGDAVNALVAGPAAGFALLVIVFAALQSFSRRISMRALFLFTSASLFILGVKFVGESFALLQQAGVLSATPISHSATMREIGLNPSWEAVLAQTMVVALALTGLVSFKRSTVEASRDTR